MMPNISTWFQQKLSKIVYVSYLSCILLCFFISNAATISLMTNFFPHPCSLGRSEVLALYILETEKTAN